MNSPNQRQNGETQEQFRKRRAAGKALEPTGYAKRPRGSVARDKRVALTARNIRKRAS